MMHYTHVLWDFNGTILDDVAAGIQSENVLLARRHMPLIQSVEQYRDLFCFPIVAYYKKLGHDFTRESYDDLAVEWVEQYRKFSIASKPYEAVEDALNRLQREGAIQVILSATERNMLCEQLEQLGLLGYFHEVLGLDNIHAYSKLEIAREWARRVHPPAAVLLGDTTHDFEVARAIGADCLLIADGHQSRAILESTGAPVYDTLRSLLESGALTQ